jgi:hypothetical protein
MNTYKPIVAPRVGTIAHAKSRNILRDCACAGCSQSRASLSPYCRLHTTRADKYGSPQAGPVKPAYYTPYRKPVADLMDANKGHAGLSAALEYVTRWLAQAVANERSFKGANEIAGLVRHGITARDILIEVCAFSCYVRLHGSTPLPDAKAEAFGLSRAVLGLVPRPRRFTAEQNAKGGTGYAIRPRRAALEHIGTHLKAVLAHVLAQVSLAVENSDAQTQEALQVPLKPPVMAYLAAGAANA